MVMPQTKWTPATPPFQSRQVLNNCHKHSLWRPILISYQLNGKQIVFGSSEPMSTIKSTKWIVKVRCEYYEVTPKVYLIYLVIWNRLNVIIIIFRTYCLCKMCSTSSSLTKVFIMNNQVPCKIYILSVPRVGSSCRAWANWSFVL